MRRVSPSRFVLASTLFAAMFGALAWACSEDPAPSQPAPDAGGSFDVDASTGGRDGAPTTADTGSDATPGAVSDAGADATTDAAVDPSLPVTCKTIHAHDPSLPSGLYAIDLDGTGAKFSSIEVYCDMTFDGGGWTMIQSFTGKDSPNNLAASADAGPGLLVGTPQPGSLGGLAGEYVAALAHLSSQVHIRTSFESDAGADAGVWVTSTAPDDGGASRVITNLRNLDVLTKDTDGGFEEWTGPQATAEKLSWVPLYNNGPATCFDPVQQTKYPSIYWACGNFTSMNLFAPQSLCRWTYSPNSGNEPLEVLVR